MARLVELQGGDPRVVEDPGLIPRAPEVQVLHAETSGFVMEVSPVSLGNGVVDLGGGRRKMGDPVDLTVGFVMEVGPGDRVEAGDPLGEVHAADPDGLSKGLGILQGAVIIGPDPPQPPPSLIRERVHVSA
jgi:thymidine phosphorylase